MWEELLYYLPWTLLNFACAFHPQKRNEKKNKNVISDYMT